jgi:two-component system, NtrC family, response regulator HydG
MTKFQGKILIVDDDSDVLITANMILKKHFQKVLTESDPSTIEKHLSNNVDLIILDMNYKPGDTNGEEGMFWLKKIKKHSPDLPVIVHTAYGDVKLAVDAMKIGAVDFIEKPWNKEKFETTIINVFKLKQSENNLVALKGKQEILQQDIQSEFDDLIAVSESMKAVIKMANKVAATDANVLILGENGTGKEMIARLIHNNSLRKDLEFIPVDLGAITETLFESELFGHEKGAFTDAKTLRIGRIEAADRGTLFFDEIGNLALSLQSKLLTVLQNKKVLRLGSNNPIKVDVRYICATNKNLKELIDNQLFRDDLMYRINTVEIHLPPLRERKDDIPVLLDYFLKKYKRKYAKENLRFDKNSLKHLKNYRWSGNIRELKHAVERAVILCDSNLIKYKDLIPLETASDKFDSANVNINELEKQAMIKALRKCDGNLTIAAKEVGLSRSTFYRKMQKYGI